MMVLLCVGIAAGWLCVCFVIEVVKGCVKGMILAVRVADCGVVPVLLVCSWHV